MHNSDQNNFNLFVDHINNIIIIVYIKNLNHFKYYIKYNLIMQSVKYS